MRTYSTLLIAGAVLTALLFAFSAFARDHTALNGTWTLVPAKSDFAGQPVVQTGTVTINERQGIITVSRSFVYEGATETFFYSDITDSREQRHDSHRQGPQEQDQVGSRRPEGDDHAIRRDYSRKLHACRGWHHGGQRRQGRSTSRSPSSSSANRTTARSRGLPIPLSRAAATPQRLTESPSCLCAAGCTPCSLPSAGRKPCMAVSVCNRLPVIPQGPLARRAAACVTGGQNTALASFSPSAKRNTAVRGVLPLALHGRQIHPWVNFAAIGDARRRPARPDQ